MATAQTVQSGVLSQIKLVTSDLFVNGQQVIVQAAVGWPSVQNLQKNVQGGGAAQSTNSAIIAIFDTQIVRNTTRWNPIVLAVELNDTSLTSSISQTPIMRGATSLLTLSPTVSEGDAVSLIATVPALGSAAQCVTAAGSDTSVTLATSLVNAINDDPVMSQWLVASQPLGLPEIQLQATQTVSQVTLQSMTGNCGTRLMEIGRRQRRLQITVFAPTIPVRTCVGDQIEQALSILQDDFGVTFPDGTMGRLMYENDFYSDKSTTQDTYRRDFFISVEYGVTTTDQLYSVLAPIAQYQVK